MEGAPEVHLVNAFHAQKARLTDDLAGLSRSGIEEVRDVLREASDRWPQLLVGNVLQTVRQDLSAALQSAEERLASLSQSHADVRAKAAEEQRRFEEYFADLTRRSCGARVDLAKFADENLGLITDWAQKTRASLRNTMRTKMRAGIVDGPRLERALRDEQITTLDDIYATIEERMLSRRDDISSHFEGVKSWRMHKPSTFRTVSRDEATKFENVASAVGSAGLGVGGGLAGAWAAVQIGAAIGTAAGPVGTAVGAVIGGVVGGLLGAWLGGKAKQGATHLRAKAATDEVFGAIDEFVSATEAELEAMSQRLTRQLEDAVDVWMRAQQDRYESERRERLGVLELSKTEREAAMAETRQLLGELARWNAKLEGGAHGAGH